MKLRKATNFERGMILAAKIVIESFDEEVVAFEILKTCGADRIDPESVDEFDRDVLVKYRAAIRRTNVRISR